MLRHFDVPVPDGPSVYLKAVDRAAWQFALVAVAAVRTGDDVTVVAGGIAADTARARHRRATARERLERLVDPSSSRSGHRAAHASQPQPIQGASAPRSGAALAPDVVPDGVVQGPLCSTSPNEPQVRFALGLYALAPVMLALNHQGAARGAPGAVAILVVGGIVVGTAAAVLALSRAWVLSPWGTDDAAAVKAHRHRLGQLIAAGAPDIGDVPPEIVASCTPWATAYGLASEWHEILSRDRRGHGLSAIPTSVFETAAVAAGLRPKLRKATTPPNPGP